MGIIRSPKRKQTSGLSRGTWFRYYADFSAEFVEDTLSHLNLASGVTLLDPWLGAGTTAQVATMKALRFEGFDINPAMLLVSKARTISASAASEIPKILHCVNRSYARTLTNPPNLDHRTEPLDQWLHPTSAQAFRDLERTINAALSGQNNSSATPIWRRTDKASALVSIFYVALFRTLRHFISRFQSSNPTWIKIPEPTDRVRISRRVLVTRFSNQLKLLHRSIESETHAVGDAISRHCTIRRGSSLRLPLASGSVDAVITSPPYCTRIDYVRATLPELAVIGYPNGSVTRRLREQMIGTPTIDDRNICQHDGWGKTCFRFLSAVEHHPSKASSTYYLRYYRQYFASIFGSFREIDRVVKSGGRCVLVVQDSYYKNVKNDLPRMFIEMADGLGWSVMKKKTFPVRQTLAGVNPGARVYRNTFTATECALLLAK